MYRAARTRSMPHCLMFCSCSISFPRRLVAENVFFFGSRPFCHSMDTVYRSLPFQHTLKAPASSPLHVPSTCCPCRPPPIYLLPHPISTLTCSPPLHQPPS